MLIVGNCIISEDIIEKEFFCDLSKCNGICCKEGDAGAPLAEDEIGVLEDIYDDIKPFMTEEGISAIEKNGGIFDYDQDGEFVTPLINDAECVFTIAENGLLLCAIEKAWKAGVINFQKPISCHLYPIRINRFNEVEALNYHCWGVCKDALVKGKREKLAMYKFLKEPLVRKYGELWYKELENQIKEKAKK